MGQTKAAKSCVLLFAISGLVVGQNVVTTIAGIDSVFSGDGMPATSVPVGYLNGVATDNTGNVYFTDPLEHLVLKLSTDGTLSVIAGNGVAGYSGDGGSATQAAIASFDSPIQYVGPIYADSLGGIAVDRVGNVYFGDSHYVRRVDRNGTITTVAGGGTMGPGDGGPATSASLGIVTGVALDTQGNLYFCEGNRIRKVTGGTISTYAGTGVNGYSGDGGPAVAAQLSQPLGLVVNGQGVLYVADGDVLNFASRVRKISSAGVISTFAGGGTRVAENGAPPTTLDLTGASGLDIDPSTGAVYMYAPTNGTLLRFPGATTNVVTHVGQLVFSDNVPALNAYVAGQRMYDNSGIALDGNGNLYVADSLHGRLRKIDTNGTITTVAGNGVYGFGGDGGPALGAAIQGPTAMTQTPDGTIYFADTLNGAVRAIAPNGIIKTVVTTATFNSLGAIVAITSDQNGNVYVLAGVRLIELTPTGTITTIVNQAGRVADTGDGGAANQAAIQSGSGLTRDATGNLYFSDPISNRIRKVSPDGTIVTIAGTGKAGISADGSIAASSPVTFPSALLPDGKGGLYFEETPSPQSVLRYITPDGLLKTIAGTAKPGFSGDGGPALQAQLSMQRNTGLVLDRAGNLYFADGFNSRVRVITPSGMIGTYAGNGTTGNSGDGGLPKNASFYAPRGLLFDAKGDLLISDVSGNRIRAVLAAPPQFTVTPSQLSFSGKAGGAQTPPQKLIMESPVEGLAFIISVSAGANWLLLGSSSGFTPRLVNVRADPSNLAPGTYQATINISSPLAAQPTTTFAVTFQVAPGDPPKLSLGKSALSFTFPINSTTPRLQVVPLKNSGTGTLAFSARAKTSLGGNWLSVNPANGSVTPQSPVILNVTADPTGLAPGTYTGTVTVSSSTTGDSAGVLVTLTVSTLDQAIQLSHAALSFIAVAGGGVVPPQKFAIINIGRGSMNFTVSARTLSGGPWLAATPPSGAAVGGAGGSQPIIVTVNQTGLAPGTYYGQVRVDSTGAANTPRVLTAVLRVLSADQDPGPVIDPNEIVFTAVQGIPPPGSMNTRVYNVSATPQTYVSSVVSSDPNYKFALIPDNATLNPARPTRIVIQPLTTGLAPGVYEAELTLQFAPDGFVRRLGIRTVVKPAPTLSSSASFGSHKVEDDATGCVASQLVPAITTLGQSFGIPAAWPVALEAEVLDDCGNPLVSGNVVVSFSNGDAPLSLQSADGGLWASTWSSGNNSGPVTLTVMANDPIRNLTGMREVTGGLGDPAPAPVLNAAVSGASFAGNTPLAPDSIISLFGQNLGNGTASAATLPLNTTLAGATVLMAGNAVPLIYGSGGQINAVVPSGININTNHQIVVQRDNTLSIPIPVDIGAAEPAIFGYQGPGDPASQAAIVNALTYAVAHPGTPVGAGDVVAIFCTGLGAVDQNVPDGAGAPASPLANTVAVPTVTIGGQSAKVVFSGLAPGFVGFYQIDALVPSGVTPGNQVPVVVNILGDSSPPVTIAVK